MDYPKRQLRLTKYLIQTKDALEWDESELLDHLKVTEGNWQKILEGRRYVSIAEFCNLAEYLDVDMDDFYNEKLSLVELKRKFKIGPESYLPERYSSGQFSRMRTSKTLLDYIDHSFGENLRTKVLKKLQVSELMVQNEDLFINMNFFTDICDTMKAFGCEDESLFYMGQFSSSSNRSSAFAKEFSKLKGPKEVYENLVPVLGVHFEKNHLYAIKSLKSNLCEIESKPTEEVLDALKSNTLGSVNSCSARRGVASSFALYHGERDVAVEEVKCIHRGDASCVYQVKWGPLLPNASLSRVSALAH